MPLKRNCVDKRKGGIKEGDTLAESPQAICICVCVECVEDSGLE